MKIGLILLGLTVGMVAQADVQCKNSEFLVKLAIQDKTGHCNFTVTGSEINLRYILGRAQSNETGIKCSRGMMYASHPYTRASLTVVKNKGQLKFMNGATIDLDCEELSKQI